MKRWRMAQVRRWVHGLAIVIGQLGSASHGQVGCISRAQMRRLILVVAEVSNQFFLASSTYWASSVAFGLSLAAYQARRGDAVSFLIWGVHGSIQGERADGIGGKNPIIGRKKWCRELVD